VDPIAGFKIGALSLAVLLIVPRVHAAEKSTEASRTKVIKDSITIRNGSNAGPKVTASIDPAIAARIIGRDGD